MLVVEHPQPITMAFQHCPQHLALFLGLWIEHPLHAADEMARMRNGTHTVAHEPPEEQDPDQSANQQRTEKDQHAFGFSLYDHFTYPSRRRPQH